jgi:serine/threonine protein kinase
MLEILADYELAPNQVVAARYRLDRIIGEGGMGVVWAATHVLTEKPCALKFIKAGRAANPKSHERLLHEARAACKVRHPNVAQVHDILELASGVPFIVMDLLDGEPLSARLARRGRFHLAEAAALLLQIVDAVSAAHALGIVHRDLKPDNVFVERGLHGRDVVKILDFGIAKHLGMAVDPAPFERSPAASVGLTTTHSMIGTPLYMAPEQLRRDRVVDGRADIWSFGLIAFECLMGDRPERDEENGGVTRAALARLATREPRLPEEVRDLIAGLLATAREARPALEGARRVLSQHVSESVDLLRNVDHTMSPSVGPAVDRPSLTARLGARPSRALVAIAALVAGLAIASVLRARDAALSPSAPGAPHEAAILSPDRVQPSAPPPSPAPPLLSPVVASASSAVRASLPHARPKPKAAPPAPAAASATASATAQAAPPAPAPDGIPSYERE